MLLGHGQAAIPGLLAIDSPCIRDEHVKMKAWFEGGLMERCFLQFFSGLVNVGR